MKMYKINFLKNYNYKKFVFLILVFVFIFGVQYCSTAFLFSAEDERLQDSKIVGELFGVPVPIGNYYFAWGIIQVFGTRWRGVPQTTGEVEEQVWIELLLSYEAFNRNITVSRKEVEEEITRILEDHKVSFDWKEATEDYAGWTQENIGAPIDLFENQVEHLLKIEKLRKQVLDSIDPEVSEEEAIQEFRNERNTLSIELIQFDELEKAQEFFAKAQSQPEFWDEEKQKNPNSFKRPGFVALEFLMHMWKFTEEDVYKMIELREGKIYPPAPIYKGYGVFKILEVRRAVEEDFPRYRQSYYNQIKTQKKYNVTSIVVTHELDSGFSVADRVAVMDNGQILEIGTREKIRASDNHFVQTFIAGPK